MKILIKGNKLADKTKFIVINTAYGESQVEEFTNKDSALGCANQEDLIFMRVFEIKKELNLKKVTVES